MRQIPIAASVKHAEAPSVPDHQLLRLIGRGSYGEVWLARNALGTPRAIKIVRRASFDSDRPYVREFSGIKKFEPISRSHEGLVDILQVGRNDAEGFFYYVMELADNASAPKKASDSSLRPAPRTEPSGDTTAFFLEPDQYRARTLGTEIASRGRIPVPEAAPIFTALAGAISHLHSRGLLHRDIKPANVIFVGDIPKLADIGLVASAGESATFVGTEGFIPPEGPGTVGADLYAFGKLMYEAVTGRDRQDFPALTLDRFDPVQNAAMMEINVILLRCCDSNPSKRYQTTDELQADLAVLRSGQSVQRLRAYEHRLRLAKQLVLAAAAAAVLALAISFVAKRQEHVATENYNRAEGLRARAEKAEREANDRLYSALVARASAERRNRVGKARENALSAVRQAAQLRPPSAELRSEAIAALALPEFTIQRRWKASNPSPDIPPGCLNADATWIASAITNGNIEIRRVEDDSHVATLDLKGAKLESIGPFSRDPRWLILNRDGRWELWDVQTGAPCDEFRGGADPKMVSPVPGNSDIMSCSGDTLRLFDPRTKSERLSRLPWSPASCAPGPMGATAAVTRPSQNVIYIWDFDQEQIIGKIELAQGARVWTLAFSPDGSTIAIAGNDRSIGIWPTLGTKPPLQIFKGHGAEVTSVAWSPSGHFLISSSWDDTTRIWGVAEASELMRWMGGSARPQFTPDGKRVAYLDRRTGEVTLSDVHYQEFCRSLVEPGPPMAKSPYRVTFTSDSRWLLSASHDGLRSFDVHDGSEAAHLPFSALYEIIQFPAPASTFVAVSAGSRLLGGWETDLEGSFRFHPLHQIERADIPSHHPLRHPWVGNLDSTLRLYSIDGSTNDLPSSAGAASAVVSGDASFVAATFMAHHAGFWTVKPMPEYHDLGPARAYGIDFSPDDKWIYYASDDELWQISTSTGKARWHIPCGSEAGKSDIKASFDGRYVVAALDPYKVMLVDTEAGQAVASFEHPFPQMVNTVAISPDSNWLAIGCTSHITQLWDLRRLREELAAMHMDWAAK